MVSKDNKFPKIVAAEGLKRCQCWVWSKDRVNWIAWREFCCLKKNFNLVAGVILDTMDLICLFCLFFKGLSELRQKHAWLLMKQIIA